MKDASVHRLGYTKTKVGWIPETWDCARIGDFAVVRQGYTFRPQYQGVTEAEWLYAKVADMELAGNGRWIRRTANSITDEVLAEMGATPFDVGSVIFPRVGAALRTNKKRLLEQRCLVDDNILVVTITAWHVCHSEFLYHWFTSVSLERFCNDGPVPSIPSGNVLAAYAPVPPLPEQQKIAAILGTWDAAIEKTGQLIAAKKKLKKALCQQLLTGKKRFRGLSKPWRQVSFGTIFKTVRRKNDKGVTHVLTASGQNGLVDQREFFNRSVAGESLDGYYLMRRGEFAYNRSLMKGYPYGAIKRLDRYDQGVVSTLYLCFALNAKDCSSDFYTQYFEGGGLNCQLRAVVQVGARAHGLLNVTASDFFSLTIPEPDIEEQKRIASVLTAADREIKLLEGKLAALQQQKQGLMQKLLTGTIRVKV